MSNLLKKVSKLAVRKEIACAKRQITAALVDLTSDDYKLYNYRLREAMRYLERALIVTETSERGVDVEVD